MSYLSERQCQFCGQSADRLAFRRETHGTDRNPYKWVFVCVNVCNYVFIYCRDRDITSRISEPLTSRNVTQHFVWSGNWLLVSFVLVIVVRHVA